MAVSACLGLHRLEPFRISNACTPNACTSNASWMQSSTPGQALAGRRHGGDVTAAERLISVGRALGETAAHGGVTVSERAEALDGAIGGSNDVLLSLLLNATAAAATAQALRRDDNKNELQALRATGEAVFAAPPVAPREAVDKNFNAAFDEVYAGVVAALPQVCVDVALGGMEPAPDSVSDALGRSSVRRAVAQRLLACLRGMLTDVHVVMLLREAAATSDAQ